ncbi:Putative BPI/LBP family protein [Apostasia shenzhenica]|uniref:BPI/LBP family protein n=1 Tax=Apostasia shenzhenica TaxID=1088818 RepID=A0A2I0AXQ9_9ASPA|nr:Putative BPI/LBP family protein [Apostasia shenzhenica]
MVAPALPFLLFLSLISNSASSPLQSHDEGFISAVVSEKGLVFVKDLLVDQAVKSLTPLRLPDIDKSVKIPLIGSVHVSISNITLYRINVSSSTIRLGDAGIAIVASGANASLSMQWRYSYSTWVLVPIELFDEGSAFVQVEGMEVDLTIRMENQGGALALNATQCSCNMEDMTIKLDGGASWFYQGFVIAFDDHIRSAVETAITKKITEGIRKLGSLLRALPKEIDFGGIAALNVTFVDDPVIGNSSIGFDIDGLFVPSNSEIVSSYLYGESHDLVYSVHCRDPSKMLGISVDEAVFNSASMVLFEEGLFHWIVDKVPDQSLLNTASWKYIIPQLYRRYPNDEMQLNVSLASHPSIKVTSKNIVAIVFSDVIIEVLDGDEAIPVACISVDFSVSGVAGISKDNKIVSKAVLKDFSLTLKWSKIGNFHMFLVQGVMRIFLHTVVMPCLNSHLSKGFPVPVIRGLAIENAQILTSSSTIVLCFDVAFANSGNFTDVSS